MVSGIAGLIMGVNPHFTAPEIKGRIMEAVDPLPSLSDKIATGGRVNLTAALTPAAYDFIPVQAGWNHVSVPFALKSGFDTAQIFAGVNSSGHSVLKYVDDLTGWTALTSSDSIVPLQGYWVFSDNYIAVPIRFESPVFGSSRSIAAGWTSIGGWNNVDISANETLNTLGNIWSYLFGYDAQTQRYDEVIIRGGSGNQSDSRPVIPYRGYWLYCFANGTYEIPLH
jgi:hypothetical protein